MVFRCVECQIGANSISSARWRGRSFSSLSSLSAFFCFHFCFRGHSAAGGVTSSVGLDGCVGCGDRLSLPEFSLFVFFFFLLLAAGSFRCWRPCHGLVVLLVTGENCMGRWVAVVVRVEYIGINLLLDNKIWFFVRSLGEKPNSFFSNTKTFFYDFWFLELHFFPSQEMWGEVWSECISGFWVTILWVFFSHHPPSLSCFFPHVPSPLLSSTKDIKMLVAAQIEVGADKLFKERKIIFIH